VSSLCHSLSSLWETKKKEEYQLGRSRSRRSPFLDFFKIDWGQLFRNSKC
jgi:hypothetical protein